MASLAEDQSLYICGGAFRDLEESLTTVYRLDLLLAALRWAMPDYMFERSPEVHTH